jgi:hypothetical protein
MALGPTQSLTEMSRCVSFTTAKPSVSRHRKSGSLDISQSYGPPPLVTGTTLPFSVNFYVTDMTCSGLMSIQSFMKVCSLCNIREVHMVAQLIEALC